MIFFEKSSLYGRYGSIKGNSCGEHIPHQDATIGTHAHHLLAVGAKSYTCDSAAVPYTLCEKSAIGSVPYAYALVGASRGEKTAARGD